MTAPRHIAAICTWCVRSASGYYVFSPRPNGRPGSPTMTMTPDERQAHVWFDEQEARKYAAEHPGIGLEAVRVRP